MTGPMFVRAARVADVRVTGCLAVQVSGHALALFAQGERVYAVDNRCPHMGFPLDRGTLHDGVLTCHWHHARFDLASGGTFDQFAGDVRAFPTEIRDGEVWVDLAPREDPAVYQRARLRDGLERNIPLVVAKAVVALASGDGSTVSPFQIGLEFGARYRQAGWGPGLTIHTCMMNLLPVLDVADRPRALYHGLAAVARDCDGMPPRFDLRPLPSVPSDFQMMRRWFRQFIEVRDAEGAERCIVSAVRGGADARMMGDLLFAAATDHRYIQIGHVLDFTNKAFDALDAAGWTYAEPVLASLAAGYAAADRMEESNEWRHPVDLVDIVERAFEGLPAALEAGGRHDRDWDGRTHLVPVLLGDDPADIARALTDALRDGATPERLAGAVAYAAALRIARFPQTNEFGDWDTALHSFSFANAVHQAVRRVGSPELLRGVFDAAMGVYLDRFLNVPPAHLPEPTAPGAEPAAILREFLVLLDHQQQVQDAGRLVVTYLANGGDPDPLLATLGHALLREDRNFHTIQAVEAAVRQYGSLRGTPEGTHVLVAAARYLAAHAPTVRAEGQTYQIAHRLFRGERLFDGANAQ
jgi:nitrite reductase/ring-hydroxylating ferredoxin subunit